MEYCYQALEEELNASNLLRHAREKPFGYPGDFWLIDKINTNRVCSKGKGVYLDEMFLRQQASQAVRNRKAFLKRKFTSLYKKYKHISLLDLASGSCREIEEWIPLITGSKHFLHFIDQDPQAIAFSKDLLTKYKNCHFKWETANVMRIKPSNSYNLIWAGGIFDYLDNRYFAFLLRKMWKWLKEEGTILIGNFHPSIPNRNQMEWCLSWFLKHRTENDLIELCHKADISTKYITIESEPLGINLFLVIEKS